jgi:YidC/Oxa1 family membrane protein insertase
MDKRTLLAVVLSMAVIILWSYIQQPVQPPEAPPVTAPTGVNAPAPGVPEAAPKPPTVSVPVTEEEPSGVELVREGGPYDALAVGWGDDYSPSKSTFAVTGRDLKLSADNPTGTLVFAFATEEYSIRRTYTFHHDNYVVDIKDEVSGTPGYQITLGGDFGMHDKTERYTHVGPVLLLQTDLEQIKPKHLNEGPKLFGGAETKWIALEDKYFCAALVPKKPMVDAKAWKYQDSTAVVFKGEPGVNEFSLYAGPKLQEMLTEAGGGLEHIVDFGFFSPISRPIFWLLKKIYAIVGNYGWAIVILTIVVRIPFIPIVNKGQRSMKRLQKVQPLMQQVKEQYKNDPKRMQAEMMNIYKKHKVNPMGGCLPMLIQIPVFFALYKVLMVAIELRAAPWALWITDLSAKDPFYILPIVMGVSMFVQQKMTPTGGDPRQQKIMMFMPVIMTFLFVNFASGLVLYWLTNNLLSIGQQIFVNKKKED